MEISRYSEYYYLLKLKNLIKKKASISNSMTLRSKEYSRLRSEIFNETNVNIGFVALKKIWETSKTITLDRKTMDTLSVYLGFYNWSNFKYKFSDELHSMILNDRVYDSLGRSA